MRPERELRELRDPFAALMDDPKPLEAEWQKLFASFPFMVIECLSLGINPQRLISCRPGQPTNLAQSALSTNNELWLWDGGGQILFGP